MRWSVKITKDRYIRVHELGCIFAWGVLTFLMLAGCQTILPHNAARSKPRAQQLFDLEHVDSKQCIAFLSQLGID